MKPNDFKNKTIILGVKIDDEPMDFFIKQIITNLTKSTQLKLYTPNPEICLKAEKDEDYRAIINNADLNTPDGFGLKLGAKILGEKLENRVTGVDLTANLLVELNTLSESVYIILRNDSLTSQENLKGLFKKKYNNIKLHIGILEKNNYNKCDDVLNDINDQKAKILFVCLGAPDQEIWINQYLRFLPNIKTALGVGGTFDFLSGSVERAPQIIRDLGMEWFYRLYQEPKRLSRIKNATAVFLLTCHKWKNRIKNEMRNNVVAVIKNHDNKYLVQKNPRFYEHWQFPQGGVDENEDFAKAAVREASEETGLPEAKLKILREIPETHEYVWKPYAQLLKGYKGQKQKAFLIEFHGTNNDFDLSQSHEAEEIKWVNKEDLIKTIHHHRHEFLQKI